MDDERTKKTVLIRRRRNQLQSQGEYLPVSMVPVRTGLLEGKVVGKRRVRFNGALCDPVCAIHKVGAFCQTVKTEE